MHSNEEIDRMREQILDLRYAGILCARTIHNFPPYGKPGGDHLQWRAVGQLMQLVFESMNRSLLFTGIALDAVLEPDPKRWDRMCKEICRMKSKIPFSIRTATLKR